jgi:LmbE family N-acetylglucosaminyl deacetylase
MSGCVVVSPHLDDAVLSAAGRLLDGDAHVVTVCAGIPAEGAPLSAWDAESGARDAAARARERLREDDQALAVLGATTTRLDELGQHYRGAPYDVDGVAKRLVPLLRDATEVWVPAGVGGHGAHEGTSRAALAAVQVTRPRAVHLYADLPYALGFGWPDRCDGLEAELRRLGHDPAVLSWSTRRLDDEQQARKQRAVRCYATQLRLLGLSADGRFADPSADGLELSWQLPF